MNAERLTDEGLTAWFDAMPTHVLGPDTSRVIRLLVAELRQRRAVDAAAAQPSDAEGAKQLAGSMSLWHDKTGERLSYDHIELAFLYGLKIGRSILTPFEVAELKLWWKEIQRHGDAPVVGSVLTAVGKILTAHGVKP